jgi:predicted dehydrogenase
MVEKVKVGVIGCGNISSNYISYMKKFDILDVVAVSDNIPERARAQAAEYGIPNAGSNDELLGNKDIRIVVNLTPPNLHAQVNLEIIAAGKSVHCEKPLATTRADGQRILAAAREIGVRVGGAPDTFLGGGLQTCRKLIDDGWIGRPVAATAFFTGHGHESWHPDPEFFYKFGGGPLFDMGPYYLTALVSLLGPARRVTGSATISTPERLITSQPHYGQKIQVEVPTHVAGVIDFANGAVASIITSFDVWDSNLPHIEIYGTEGTLSVPDPNTFTGPVKIKRAGADAWSEVPLTHNAGVGRGIGVADMAYGIMNGRPHRASGELAYHVLDIMHAIIDASECDRHVMVDSICVQPTPLPMGLRAGELDA